nr:MAG TPA: hypothetical protein [Caudoviricetes sp.]
MKNDQLIPADGIPVVHEVVAERGQRYGSFAVNAECSQAIKRAMRAAHGWQNLTDAQREGLEMIAAKMARMLTGDPEHLDNAVDIGGYAQCMVQAMAEAASGVQRMTLGRSVLDDE